MASCGRFHAIDLYGTKDAYLIFDLKYGVEGKGTQGLVERRGRNITRKELKDPTYHVSCYGQSIYPTLNGSIME